MRKLLAAVSAAVLLMGCTPSSPASAACPPLSQSSIIAGILRGEIIIAPRVKASGVYMNEFFEFCKREPQAVMCRGGEGRKLTLNEVKMIDAKLRTEFEYRADETTFGDDRWQFNSLCGDCDDHVLTLSERLHAAGAAGATMGMVMWLPDDYTAHATLLVDTADAGYVEIGVGSAELPKPIDWTEGRRLAILWMDGKREVSDTPMKEPVVLWLENNQASLQLLTPEEYKLLEDDSGKK